MIRLPRRPPPQVEPMIPLINVAFLLLAFFMFTGRMDANAPFTVVPPRSELGAPLPRGGATVSVSASGELALNGVPRTLADIVAELGSRAAAGEVEFVRINADAEAPLRHVLPLVGELEARQVPRVALIVTPASSSAQ